MELILKLEDESKLDVVLSALRRLTSTEGVNLAVESPEGRPMLESQNDSDHKKWDEIMSRNKLRPGQTPMTEEEEVEFINQAVKETRAARHAQQNA